jgi:hypothetical protein
VLAEYLAPFAGSRVRFYLGGAGGIGSVPGTAATTASTLAARPAFGGYDDASSADYYAEALSAAGRLPGSWHRAAVRASHAMVTLYATGDLPKAQASTRRRTARHRPYRPHSHRVNRRRQLDAGEACDHR